MTGLFSSLFAKRNESAPARDGAPRLSAPRFPAAIYAVGDIHGRLDLLKRLEDEIVADAQTFKGDIWLVMLGDYVDRGPASAQTLSHLLTSTLDGIRRICLGGNHEQTMLEALDNQDTFNWWCGFGGMETLASYGLSQDIVNLRWDVTRKMLDDCIPAEHRTFLADLPVMLSVPGYIFVHAGLAPGIGPEDQSDHDLRWIRDPFLEDGFDFGATIVHGHTVAPEVHISDRRIGLDLGAYASGRLAAVRLTQGRPPKIIEIQH